MTQDRIPLDAGSSRPVVEGEMGLEVAVAKAICDAPWKVGQGYEIAIDMARAAIEAVNAWNRRALSPTPSPAELVERIHKRIDIVADLTARAERAETALAAANKRLEDAGEVNRALLDWAEARCPCHDEKPDPCPLCGASAKPGGGHCMSAKNTLPRYLLEKLRAARRYLQKREAK